jgi:hypothetical protein
MPTDAYLLRIALRTYQRMCRENPLFVESYDSYEIFKRKLQRSRALRRKVLAGVRNSLGKLVLDLTYARKHTAVGVPRPFSLVKHTRVGIPQPVVFLGEIPNVPGHCAVLLGSGQCDVGYHTFDFKELTDEEV